MHWALAHGAEMAAMGAAARALYEREYTATANLRQLLTIYADAIAVRQREAAA
jgi:hypothetical protein